MVKNIYFDCEFTGLHKDTTLISIGFITDEGKTFYAEFNDFDKNIYSNKWIVDNVLKNTKYLFDKDNIPKSKIISSSSNMIMLGSKLEVREELLKFLKRERGSEQNVIQFVSDCCHYDMVLLIDLLVDNALELHSWISPVCHELNNDISKFYKVSILDAFNMCREDLLFPTNSLDGNKHNSLYDARVIKDIYNSVL